jgi:hypothetical protein
VVRGVQASERIAALKIDVQKVIVPQGPSVDSYVSSGFRYNERILYDERLVRPRYIVSHTATACTFTLYLTGQSSALYRAVLREYKLISTLQRYVQQG